MKIVNNNGNGPFGGNIAFQVAGASTGNTTTAAAASTASAASTAKSTKTAKASKSGKRGMAFQA
jgi:hypothetical protein